MRQIGLIVGILVLAAALVYLNNGINKNAKADHDDDQSSQQAAPPPHQTIASGTGKTMDLLPEETIGNPSTAKYKVTVGWNYDEMNQPHPEALEQALGAVRDYVQGSSNMSAQMVDVDLPSKDRSPINDAITKIGIAINGRPLPYYLGVSNPGEGEAIASNIPMALHIMAR